MLEELETKLSMGKTEDKGWKAENAIDQLMNLSLPEDLASRRDKCLEKALDAKFPGYIQNLEEARKRSLDGEILDKDELKKCEKQVISLAFSPLMKHMDHHQKLSSFFIDQTYLIYELTEELPVKPDLTFHTMQPIYELVVEDKTQEHSLEELEERSGHLIASYKDTLVFAKAIDQEASPEQETSLNEALGMLEESLSQAKATQEKLSKDLEAYKKLEQELQELAYQMDAADIEMNYTFQPQPSSQPFDVEAVSVNPAAASIQAEDDYSFGFFEVTPMASEGVSSKQETSHSDWRLSWMDDESFSCWDIQDISAAKTDPVYEPMLPEFSFFRKYEH